MGVQLLLYMERVVSDGCTAVTVMERVVGDGCTPVIVHGAGGR